MDKKTKEAYCERDIISEIEAAVNLLCESRGFCTPTDVLRLIGLPETNELRTVVLNVATRNEFPVKSSGRGYRILDW